MSFTATQIKIAKSAFLLYNMPLFIMTDSKQGLFTVIAAIAIQLTLGIAYIWSVFQTGIAESIFGGDHAKAALSFSLLIAVLSVGSFVGGKLTERFSTRFVVFIGGIILAVGFFLAGLVTANFPWLMWVTYGIMGGMGMGFSYSTTIACAQKWYPHKKGLVTGITVSAMGFGGVIFAPAVEAAIKAFGGTGVGESGAFMVLSVVFLVVCTAGSVFLKNPPEGYMVDAAKSASKGSSKVVRDYTAKEMLGTPQFYLISLTFLVACIGGLMVIGFAKPIAVDKGIAENVAVYGVMAIAVFNSLGRLTWGAVSDKLGRVNTVMVMLAGSAIFSLFVLSAEGYWVFALLAICGFFYGGFLGTFPSLTSDHFGVKYLASNYGIVLLGLSVGAILSSRIAGHYKNVAADDINLMFPAFVIASCCAGAGIVMMVVLKVLNKRAKQ